MYKKITRGFVLVLAIFSILLLLPACGLTVSGSTESQEEAAKIKEIDKLIERSALQYPAKNDEFCYNVYEGYVGITKYVGQGGEVTVPGELEGLPVYTIGNSVFFGSTITSVVVSEGIVEIGDSCFEECKELTSISLPESLRRVGEDLLASCSALTELTIPSRISFIPSSICYECTALKTVKILAKNAKSEIDTTAFLRCTSLENVYITGEVVAIDSNAFAGVPESVVFHGPKACAAAEYCADKFFTYVVTEQPTEEAPSVEPETTPPPTETPEGEPKPIPEGAISAKTMWTAIGLGLAGVALVVGVIIFIVKWRNRY